MMEPTNEPPTTLVGEPPPYSIACHIPGSLNGNGLPREIYMNATDAGESGHESPGRYPSPTPPPPPAFLSPEPVLNLQESVLGKPAEVTLRNADSNFYKSESSRENSVPGTPQYRWSFSDQPINFNSDDESYPPPPPEFMTEEENPKTQFSYSTDSDGNVTRKVEVRKNRRPNKNKHKRVETVCPAPPPPIFNSFKSTSPEGVSSNLSDCAPTNIASVSDVHLRQPMDRAGKSNDNGQMKRVKPYASPMLPTDIKFKSLEVSSYDDDSAQGSCAENDMADHDDVRTPLLQVGASSPAETSNLSSMSGGTRNSFAGLSDERMRNYAVDSDVRLPLLKISSDPREQRKSRDRLNKQDSKSDTRSSQEMYEARSNREGSYPAEAEITISNDDLSGSNQDIPNTFHHSCNATGYAASHDSDSRHVVYANNKRDSAGRAPWQPGQSTDPDNIDTIPKERKKSRLKKPFRSRSYPICIAVSFTTMLCINPPIGVVAVFLSYLSWKAYDKGDKTAGYCLARLSLYVSIAGIVTTMTLVITILYQTTIGF